MLLMLLYSHNTQQHQALPHIPCCIHQSRACDAFVMACQPLGQSPLEQRSCNCNVCYKHPLSALHCLYMPDSSQ